MFPRCTSNGKIRTGTPHRDTRHPKLSKHQIAPELEPFIIPIGDLHNMEGNPRIGNIKVIEGSLSEFGLRVPLVFRNEPDPDGGGTRKVVYAGNHRLKAARNLGWTHVAAVNADDMSHDQIRAFSLADNRTADLGTYDEELLTSMLEDAAASPDVLFESLGYPENFLDNLDLVPTEPLGEEPSGTSPQYSRKIVPPVYEPTGAKPTVAEIYDATKTEELLAAIEAAPGLPEDVKAFLVLAAHRHTVFDYQNIAEFYAHSEPDVQQLFEDSALVIIDIEAAIENGFVQLSQTLIDIAGLDTSTKW